MVSRGLLTVVVLLLVAAAGCSGLGDDPDVPTVTPAPVPEDETPDQVVTTEVTTEPAATFTPENPSAVGPLNMRDQYSTQVALWRLRQLLAVDVAEPTVVRRLGPMIDPGPNPVSIERSVVESLGPDVSASGGTLYGRVDTGNATIHLVKGMHDATLLEYNLAYFHAQLIQDRLGWTDAISVHENGTLDQRLVAFALHRGGAAFAADSYAERYSLSIDEPVREWEFSWLDSPWLARSALDAGYDHARGNVNPPSALGRLYTDPPNTTEQLLHGFSTETEPPRPLDVTVEDGSGWNRTATERFGELGIRALLSTRIDGEEADRAARGWGNDRILAFENETDSGVVWTTTWDQPAYADQFATGFEQYAAAGEPPQASVLRRPDSETVVVAAGSPAFVDATTIGAENGSVRVSIGE